VCTLANINPPESDRPKIRSPKMTNTTAAPANTLLLPVYASKPQRRIPGTNCVAVTMYRSNDGSVREYAVFTADGTASIGRAHWQGKRKAFSAGYTIDRVATHRSEKWANLTEFTTAMGERLNVEVTA
jgi:hypothetical protein